MGKTQSTGNLTNALAQDSSNNIGIGGAVNASFKLQVTGATNLTSDLTVNGLTVGRGAGAIVSNTAVGLSALPVNTTGTLNTAIGNLALLTNTTGYGNTSVGYGAIGYNTTGFFNAAIGVNALLFNSTGTYNNALGTAALYANTTGSYNTAVGQQAGTANTTGSNNTYIGYSSGFNITTGSNNTIIGRYFGTAAMANNIVLADGAGNVRYQWDGTNNQFNGATQFNSNVSINTGGQASLSIISSAGNSSEILSYVSGVLKSTISTSATEFKLISAIDNILKFQSSTNFRASLIFSNSADYSYTFPSATGTLALTSNLSAYLPLTGGTLTGALSGTSATFSGEVGVTSGLLSISGAGATPPTGGVGFRFVSNRLIVYGGSSDITFQKNDNSGPNLTILNSGAATFSSSVTAGTLGVGTSPIGAFKVSIQGDDSGQVLRLRNTTTRYRSDFSISNSGELGINCYDDTASTYMPIKLDASKFSFLQGNVGIGTSSPSNKLTISNNGNSAVAFRINDTNANASFLSLNASDSDAAIIAGGTSAIPFDIYTGGVARIRITSSGNVGIGQSSPDRRLRVGSDGSNWITGVFEGSGGTDVIVIGNIAGYNPSTGATIGGHGTALNVWANMQINPGGGAVYAGTQRIDNNSDERIKENIESINNALNVVLSLKGRKFNMIDEDNILRYGFVAQEVQPHLSDFVTQSKREYKNNNIHIENLLTLESSGASWGALLVEAIKEQQAQIEELKQLIKNK